MTARPPARVLGGTAPTSWPPPGWTATTIDALPPEPFALGGHRLAIVTSVADDDDASEVLLALARGVGVAVTLRLDPRAAERFLDDVRRLAELDEAGPPILDVEHRRLLDELADGATLTDAAKRLGYSRRTATRRLAEAVERLGVSSTAQAVRLHRRDRPPD